MPNSMLRVVCFITAWRKLDVFYKMSPPHWLAPDQSVYFTGAKPVASTIKVYFSLLNIVNEYEASRKCITVLPKGRLW